MMMDPSISIAADGAGTVGAYEYRFPRAFIQGNAATFATYALGTLTIALFCLPAAAIYALYCVASTVAMWATVCVNCPYYGSVCPCGYSTMSAALFRKGDVRLMPRRYKLIWAYVAPSWLAPVFAAVPLLVHQFNWTLFVTAAVFTLMALLIAPAVSKAAGCCEYWRGCTVPIETGDSGEPKTGGPW